MPKVIFGICRRKHCNLEGKVVNSNEYVIDQRNVRYKWNTVPWRKLERFAFKLQKRIYQAEMCNNIKKVHKLQRLLLNSISAKLLAVRKVTQDNRGKKTAGIDGKANLNKEERLQLAYSLNIREKAKPSRRIWIPKPGKTEKRPLGIPTISERAKETLMKMAIEPEWEAKFEPNTYGFRPGRSCHDAIGAIFISLKGKTAYCLDADISGCFDNIDHKALLKKLNTTPTLRRIIRGWLRAGVMEGRKFKPTKRGTIQGGTISPLLACIALHGLEQYIKETLISELLQHAKKKYGIAGRREAKSSMSVIFYADDFIIVHESMEIILKAKRLTEEWLKTIGLELKPSKTRISHTLDGKKPGFDFLGFSIRQYPTRSSKKGYKLLIKPGRESIKQHASIIKRKLRGLRGATQEAVIKELNPITRGWSQYYSSVVSSKTFKLMDSVMFRKLWKWAEFRHPKKGKCWIKRRYFKKYGNDNWCFMTSNKPHLVRHGDHVIKRHIKVKGTKSLYDGDWVYWGNRLGKIPDKSPRVIRLLKLQRGKCDNCQLWFKDDDILEIHHKDQNRRNNMIKNLSLLHGHCHDVLHRSGHDKHQIREKPDDGKLSSPVLKSSEEGRPFSLR
ncbi:group II intron reverse transcriptase/maturase [Wolbachia endosymbiont (group B) of Sphaerophoria taeniata]|uniref:group II intron reverse transcriptase/maturase n=1 Tax=Wolbachia endosymbiont (group B) of Sphaerophoria taeniata TaxID=2954058 RepID=UPI00221E5FC6|nr:group II intron reverse transcriptase/maturase [Wolbachia endosymbiont (group B) of Sphaerophoria taeniata]